MRTKTVPEFPGYEARQYSRLGGGQPTGNVLVGAHMKENGEYLASFVATWTSSQLKRLDVTEVEARIHLSLSDRWAMLELTNAEGKHARVYGDIPSAYGKVVGDDTKWVVVNRNLLGNLLDAARCKFSHTSLLPAVVVADLERIMHKHADLWRTACKYAVAMTTLTNA